MCICICVCVFVFVFVFVYAYLYVMCICMCMCMCVCTVFVLCLIQARVPQEPGARVLPQLDALSAEGAALLQDAHQGPTGVHIILSCMIL